MKGEHIHGPDCGHTSFRGIYYNTPKLRKEWTREQCWIAGLETATRSFRRDIIQGGKNSKRKRLAREQSITWSDAAIAPMDLKP